MTQNEALDILKTGANVFLTGEPGAGKTYTINSYVRYLKEHEIEPAITASTGIAATHISGMTIHSWSGIGIKETLTKYDLDKIASSEYVNRRVRRTKVLIIDEISMLRAEILSMVDSVCREIKQSNEPFGGIQVILVGDFFQLPPIEKNYSEQKQEKLIEERKARFAYESESWRRLALVICYISEQYRQDDKDFLEILSAIRHDTFKKKHHTKLKERHYKEKKFPENITKLFSHNLDVDKVNEEMLQKIEGDLKEFEMESNGKDFLVSALKKGCLSPEKLFLKKGAVVMCTKNNPKEKFVNGTLGIVEEFDSFSNNPIIKTKNGRKIEIAPMDWVVEENGKIKAQITQIPLRLAWAITVHKSQGMSMDAAVMDLSQVFEFGQGYVALSRVRRLSGLYLLGINNQALKVHPQILEQDNVFRNESLEAQKTFGEIFPYELKKMHKNFVLALGGEWERANLGAELPNYLKLNNRQKEKRWERTFEMIKEGKTIEQVACLRGRNERTILEHLEALKKIGKLSTTEMAHLFNQNDSQIKEIHLAMEKIGAELLKPIYDHFDGKISYETIRLARLFFK